MLDMNIKDLFSVCVKNIGNKNEMNMNGGGTCS